jgi:hypothetical protein
LPYSLIRLSLLLVGEAWSDTSIWAPCSLLVVWSAIVRILENKQHECYLMDMEENLFRKWNEDEGVTKMMGEWREEENGSRFKREKRKRIIINCYSYIRIIVLLISNYFYYYIIIIIFFFVTYSITSVYDNTVNGVLFLMFVNESN